MEMLNALKFTSLAENKRLLVANICPHIQIQFSPFSPVFFLPKLLKIK